MATVIHTKGLVKSYGKVRALDGLDLDVEAGQIHGFLGPNGAGKSTTIRVLLGLARPTSGEAAVFGGDPWRDAVYTAEKERLMHEFQFDPRKKGRAYSKGNRQKVALISALSVPADLYVFDEPTSGLDPLMEVVFRAEIDRLRAAGATVLLSSHILSEVELLCDRVSIIRAGKIVESGTLAELRHLTRTEVSFDATTSPVGISGAHDVTLSEGRARFTVDSDAVNGILPVLAQRDVKGLRIEPPSLEELFLRHYGDDLTALEDAKVKS